jgi:CBS domain containing-hemolysin-like protein
LENKRKIKESHSIKKKDYKWVLFITLSTFLLSMAFAFISDVVMPNARISVALVVLAVFISIGIFFDVIGLAIATASEAPFHSMASRKVNGARQAIFLIRNAEKASNFCNDVVGDIAGIISGATSAAIVARFVYSYGWEALFVPLIFTGAVAAITVGGKALGKGYSMRNANKITYEVALILFYFDRIRGKEANHGDFR